MNNLNRKAAQLILSEDNEQAEAMREAVEKQVGKSLKSAIAASLSEKTSLSGDKIQEVCDDVVGRYIDQ